MHVEITQAVEFLGRLLQSKVDSNVISKFKSCLAEILTQRFTNHWDPQQPYRGNGYRAITNFNGELDPVILEACEKANCNKEIIHTHLPKNLTLWADPYSVAYRIGDHGNIMTLYEDISRNPVPIPQYTFMPMNSTPIRISPPSSPENKKIKAHLHQPSPLSNSSTPIVVKKDIILAN